MTYGIIIITIISSNKISSINLIINIEEQYDAINVAIIATVRTDKSTLTNSLFVEQYSDMNIKKTRAMPQIYIETQKLNIKENYYRM